MNIEQIFVGTYTSPILFGTGDILEGKGEGIYLVNLDTESGELSLIQETKNIINPSYLCISNSKKFLYAVNELKEYNGSVGGSVSSFEIISPELPLKYLNTQPTIGTDPCHVCINNDDTYIYVSNFMSGSVIVYPILEDGSIDEHSHFIQHEGSSVHQKRQLGPHAHSLTFSFDEKFAFVPDLGIDEIVIYKSDFKTGKLNLSDPSCFKSAPGSGPRHCEFHPNGKYCYLINEITSSISLLNYNKDNGLLELVQTIDTIPSDFKEDNICADLHITPNGKFLYGSNRGHNSIASYKISENDGRVTLTDIIPCGGKTPRNFTVGANGKFLVVGNQDTDNILSFKIDSNTGRLTPVCEIKVPTPVCVKIF